MNVNRAKNQRVHAAKRGAKKEQIMASECELCKKSVCECGSKEVAIATISAEDLKKKIETNPNLVVINVLTKESYDDCHIKGSINIVLTEFEEKAKMLDKAKSFVVYCANYECSASRRAFELMRGLGFDNVVAYEGGTEEWRKKGFPTEGACVQSY